MLSRMSKANIQINNNQGEDQIIVKNKLIIRFNLAIAQPYMSLF